MTPPSWLSNVEAALHAAATSAAPAGSKPLAIAGTDLRLDFKDCPFFNEAADRTAFLASVRSAVYASAGPGLVQATSDILTGPSPHMRVVFHNSPAALLSKRLMGDQGHLAILIGGSQVSVPARLIAGTKPPGWIVLIAHHPMGPAMLRATFWQTVLSSAGYTTAAAACTASFLPNHAGASSAHLDCSKIIAYAPPLPNDSSFSNLPRDFGFDGGSSHVYLTVADQDNAVKDSRSAPQAQRVPSRPPVAPPPPPTSLPPNRPPAAQRPSGMPDRPPTVLAAAPPLPPPPLPPPPPVPLLARPTSAHPSESSTGQRATRAPPPGIQPSRPATSSPPASKVQRGAPAAPPSTTDRPASRTSLSAPSEVNTLDTTMGEAHACQTTEDMEIDGLPLLPLPPIPSYVAAAATPPAKAASRAFPLPPPPGLWRSSRQTARASASTSGLEETQTAAVEAMDLPLSGDLFLWAEDYACDATAADIRAAIRYMHRRHPELFVGGSADVSSHTLRIMQATFLQALDAVNPSAAAAAVAAQSGYDTPDALPVDSSQAAAAAADEATWALVGTRGRSATPHKARPPALQQRDVPAPAAVKHKARDRSPAAPDRAQPVATERRSSSRVVEAASKAPTPKYWQGTSVPPAASASTPRKAWSRGTQ